MQWWGSGLCFQIALMAALGVMAKIRVPYAHTSLEIIKQRYGKIGHSVFIVMNLINNVFGCASMILTGSQLVYGVSGMHFVAACIIIPFGGEWILCLSFERPSALIMVKSFYTQLWEV